MDRSGAAGLGNRWAVREARRSGGTHEHQTSGVQDGIAQLRANMTKRDLWIVLTLAGLIAAGITVLGILIRWPG